MVFLLFTYLTGAQSWFVVFLSGRLLLDSMIDWCMPHPNSSAHDPKLADRIHPDSAVPLLCYLLLFLSSLLM